MMFFNAFYTIAGNTRSRNFGFRVARGREPWFGTLSSGGRIKNYNFIHIIR